MQETKINYTVTETLEGQCHTFEYEGPAVGFEESAMPQAMADALDGVDEERLHMHMKMVVTILAPAVSEPPCAS